MTSLTLNTASASSANNIILSMPTVSSVGKKTSAAKNYVSYSIVPKSWSRKPATKLSSIDWDLNMNELEFE